LDLSKPKIHGNGLAMRGWHLEKSTCRAAIRAQSEALMSPDNFEREAINRRAKHMAMARPFFAVEGGKGHAGVDLAAYDMHRVALVILDCIIVEMGGHRRGATIDSIIAAVRPALRGARPDCSDVEADRVASYALDALTNEREREQFRASYQVQDQDGSMRWVSFRFKLIDVRESPEGDIVYYAEPAAINFYLSSLEIDIEAEQAAKDGAHEYYMKRGRFSDAVQTAEAMLKLTISYRERLLRTASIFSRDIRGVNYIGEIIPALKGAREHIDHRMQIEGRHLDDVRNRLDEASGEALGQLARIHQVFITTRAFYTALIGDVLSIDQSYLAEQARQRFRPVGGPLALADPMRDVLLPALSVPAAGVLDWVQEHMACFAPARFPTLPILTDMAALLLQDPQVRIGGEVVAEDSLEELHPLVRFDDDALDAAAGLLGSCGDNTRLSELLLLGRQQGAPPAALRHLVLKTFQWYEGGEVFAVEAGGMLDDTEFRGDDLTLRRLAP
jgi:hypothetical protein